MKKTLLIAFSAALFAVSCTESKTDTVTTADAQTVAASTGDTYTINADSSTVKWTATHKGGFDPRYGTTAAAGSLTVENGVLTAGTLTSDLNTLTTNPAAVDPAKSEGKTSADLDAHLKSADFFDVAKYPSVKFEITDVSDLAAGTESKTPGANKIVSGNLTIKDKTVNVSFPALVEVSENQVKLVSTFTINREDWGLSYGTEGDPKDWFISQAVELDLNLVATK